LENVKAILCPKGIPVFPLPQEGEDKVENLAKGGVRVMIPFFSPLTLTLSPNGERESMKMSYCLKGNLLTHFLKMGIFLLIILLMLPSLAQSKSFSSLNNKGNKFYFKGDYQGALELYKKAEEKSPKSPVISNNLGNVAHQQGDFGEAEKYYQRALDNTNKLESANSLYNLGNNYFRRGQMENALQSYEKCLELNPSDRDAKYNIEFIKRMQKQNQEQEQKKSQQKEKQNSQKENQKKNEEQKQQQEQKEKEQQQKQSSQQQNEKQKEEQKQEEQQKFSESQPKMSKEEAEGILSAVKEKEKELLEKQKKFGEIKTGRVGKDW
jgi:Ca-activated chloride channel homolog